MTVPVGTQSTAYQNLKLKAENLKLDVVNIYAGDEISMGDVKFEVVWPERNWVLAHTSPSVPLRSKGREEEKVRGRSTVDAGTNEFSIGGILRFGEFEMAFTGDADIEILDDQLATGLLSDVDVLKVAHHGSKYGTTGTWLSIVKPELAVVSVGKNNRYGHPADEIIKLLSDLEIKMLRTDLEGDVEIVTDGLKWWVK